MAILCLTLVANAFVEVRAFDTRDLEKLNVTRMCKSCNLSRINLAGVNLSNSDLNKTSLKVSDLSYGKVIKVNLTKADLTGTVFLRDNYA